jgi:HAD superfamily hydrolase (TIGR01509 family)
MDGLMFNTEEIYDEVGSILLCKRGREFTRDLKRKIMGRQNFQAMEILIHECDLHDTPETLARESEGLYLELLPQHIRRLRGLESLLSSLESRKIPKAVATSSSRKLATETLGIFDLETRFEFVLTGDDVTRGKPDPEIYLAASHKLEKPPNLILVLEDSINGTKAAVAAGMFTVAIPSLDWNEGDFDHVNHVLEALDSPMLGRLLGFY